MNSGRRFVVIAYHHHHHDVEIVARSYDFDACRGSNSRPHAAFGGGGAVVGFVILFAPPSTLGVVDEPLGKRRRRPPRQLLPV